MISCVIHTFNSELYLAECLESISWCDEIVIIDMHSSDGTIDICNRFGAKVIFHQNVGYADPARQFGLDKTNGDWILSVDSDEIIPSALARKLREISVTNDFDCVSISRRNFMFGREIRGGGWGYESDHVPRFFKRGYINYTGKVHDFIRVHDNARTYRITDQAASIIHFNYISVHQFINKLNVYTDAEVDSEKYNYRGAVVYKFIYHFFRELFGRFFVLKGYRDGWLGFYLAFSMAFYRISCVAKANTKKESLVVDLYKSSVNTDAK